MKNQEKYEKIFIENFGVTKARLKKDLKYNSIPKWDSVGHMGMIAKIEEVFNITIEMDDIIDFSSFLVGKKILKKYKIKI